MGKKLEVKFESANSARRGIVTHDPDVAELLNKGIVTEDETLAKLLKELDRRYVQLHDKVQHDMMRAFMKQNLNWVIPGNVYTGRLAILTELFPKHPGAKCRKCGSPQMQLSCEMGFGTPAVWRCRKCGEWYHWEPSVYDQYALVKDAETVEIKPFNFTGEK